MDVILIILLVTSCQFPLSKYRHNVNFVCCSNISINPFYMLYTQVRMSSDFAFLHSVF